LLRILVLWFTGIASHIFLAFGVNISDGGKNGNKLRYVEKKIANKWKKKGNHTYCILADMEQLLSPA